MGVIVIFPRSCYRGSLDALEQEWTLARGQYASVKKLHEHNRTVYTCDLYNAARERIIQTQNLYGYVLRNEGEMLDLERFQ